LPHLHFKIRVIKLCAQGSTVTCPQVTLIVHSLTIYFPKTRL